MIPKAYLKRLIDTAVRPITEYEEGWWEECPACEGEGELAYDPGGLVPVAFVVCPTCRGRGVIPHDHDEDDDG